MLVAAVPSGIEIHRVTTSLAREHWVATNTAARGSADLEVVTGIVDRESWFVAQLVISRKRLADFRRHCPAVVLPTRPENTVFALFGRTRALEIVTERTSSVADCRKRTTNSRLRGPSSRLREYNATGLSIDGEGAMLSGPRPADMSRTSVPRRLEQAQLCRTHSQGRISNFGEARLLLAKKRLIELGQDCRAISDVGMGLNGVQISGRSLSVERDPVIASHPEAMAEMAAICAISDYQTLFSFTLVAKRPCAAADLAPGGTDAVLLAVRSRRA